MEQLISHIRIATADNIDSLGNSDQEFIPISEVLDLIIKIHNILYRAVSKWIYNAAYD